MKRLFVGLDLPPSLQKGIASARNAFEAWDKIRWIQRANLHLTLKFLGNCPDEMIEKAGEKLVKACAQTETFDAELASWGAFPAPRRARILWIGIDKGCEETTKLQATIDRVLVSLGHEIDDRAFHPHVTAARLRELHDLRDMLDVLNDKASLEGRSFSVKYVTLFESRLKPDGAEYEAISKFPLAGAEH